MTATYVGLRAATEHRDYQLARTPGPALRLRRRDPLDRASPARWRSPSGCGRRWRRRGSTSRDGPETVQPADAEHRRVRHAPLPGGRADRARPRLRPDRLLLRAGHPRRDRRRAGEPDPARRRRRPAPSDPCADGTLPGLLLRRRGRIRAGWRRRMAIDDGPVDRGRRPGGPRGRDRAPRARHLPGHGDRARARGRRDPAALRPHGLRSCATCAPCSPGPRYARALSRARGGGRRRGPHRDDGHRLGGSPPAEADRAARPRRRSSRRPSSSRPAAASAPVPRGSSPARGPPA